MNVLLRFGAWLGFVTWIFLEGARMFAPVPVDKAKLNQAQGEVASTAAMFGVLSLLSKKRGE